MQKEWHTATKPLNIGKENRRKTSEIVEIVVGDIHLQFYLILSLCPGNVVLVRNT